MRLRAWGIFKEGVLAPIDVVFFHPDCDEEYVRYALVYHDGYPDTIEVREVERND